MSRLKNSLSGLSTALIIDSKNAFADLLWEPAPSVTELLQLGPAVSVENPASRRKLVIHEIANELRYWAATDDGLKDAFKECELGTFPSEVNSVEFCSQFLLGGVALRDVNVPHTVLSRRKQALERELADQGLLEGVNRGMLTVRDSHGLAELIYPNDDTRSALEAVVIEGRTTPRGVVFQRSHKGLLRYQLFASRFVEDSDQEQECGELKSIEDAVALCTEFLTKAVRIDALVTPRNRRG